MPIMSGRVFLDLLHQDPHERPAAVIVLTASAVPNVEPGYPNISVLGKPIDLNELIDQIRGHCTAA
jgi:CheY-like chemotaxis protein